MLSKNEREILAEVSPEISAKCEAAAATEALLRDCEKEFHFRQRGREARLARLAAAGVPLDRDGMAAWHEREADRLHEQRGGVYFACTVRISSGVDSALPTLRGLGCRIVRVPIDAEEIFDEDGNRRFRVRYGFVGPGYMEPDQVLFPEPDDDEREAERIIRNRLLKSGECFLTRAEARVAVEKMLEARVAKLIK